jgi:hypothetical protein
VKPRLRSMGIIGAAFALMLDAGLAGAATNLLNNSSFETGDFSGWTVLNTNPSPNNAMVSTNVDLIEPEDGKFQSAFLGSAGPQIAQTLTDTLGEELEVTAWYAVTDSLADLEFMIAGAEHDAPIGAIGIYQRFQFEFVATGSDTLQIFSVAQADSVNLVDNLSVVPAVGAPPAVPEVSTWAMMLVGFLSLGLIARGQAGGGKSAKVKKRVDRIWLRGAPDS